MVCCMMGQEQLRRQVTKEKEKSANHSGSVTLHCEDKDVANAILTKNLSVKSLCIVNAVALQFEPSANLRSENAAFCSACKDNNQ